MLKSLYIKDYALVDELRVEFHSGLNIITGETGAGKSIIVGALGVLLGDKFSKEVLRKDAGKAILEAEFDVPGNNQIQNYCLEHDIDYDGLLIIRRELNSSGRSRTFVNDSPVTMPILEELGNLLVDLHGQHQHQLLLQSNRHIEYLDDFTGLDALVKDFRNAFQKFQNLKKELNEVLLREKELKQLRDVHSFQLNEIKTVNPLPAEDDELEKEEKILKNSEVLFDTTQALYDNLYDKDNSAYELVSNANLKISTLQEIDEQFAGLKDEIENASIIIQDVAKALGDYNGKINFDPERLEDIRQRLAALNGLKKKYGATLENVLEHKEHIEKELDRIDNLDNEITDLRKSIGSLTSSLVQNGMELFEKRKMSSEKLSEQVTNELAGLGMEKSRFRVNTELNFSSDNNSVEVEGQPVKLTQRGLNKVEFLISANAGEDLKPLTSVASGGEISRIMLALKTLLAEADQVPVLVFDEIDIGISGRIAQAVGKSMRKLAETHQIICITHLPQIAGSGHHHYLVEKLSDEKSTSTFIRNLSVQERIEQIARLIGGESLSDAHLKSAAELLKESEYAE